MGGDVGFLHGETGHSHACKMHESVHALLVFVCFVLEIEMLRSCLGTRRSKRFQPPREPAGIPFERISLSSLTAGALPEVGICSEAVARASCGRVACSFR